MVDIDRVGHDDRNPAVVNHRNQLVRDLDCPIRSGLNPHAMSGLTDRNGLGE